MRCCFLAFAFSILVFIPSAQGQQNPTTSTTGSITIINDNRITGNTGQTATVQFTVNLFRAAWPGQPGLATIAFSPPIFTGALPFSAGASTVSGCGTGCDWTLGLHATFYQSNGLQVSDTTVLTGGTRIASACSHFPHPSLGSMDFASTFFTQCLAGYGSVNWAVRMSGFINMQAGLWTFFSESDDASRIWINTNTLVVDNSGTHGMTEKSGTVNIINAGWKEFTVELGQGTGGAGLNVRWQKNDSPAVAKGIIPASAFAPFATLQSPLVLAFYGGSSLITNTGQVQLFNTCDFTGTVYSRSAGDYDLSAMGIPNDALSSMRVPLGMTVTIYQHSAYGGVFVTYDQDTSLCGTSYDNWASSLKVAAVTSMALTLSGLEFVSSPAV